MEIEHSIPKKHGLSNPSSFEALRKEGIRLIQEMSGDVWTDYNLHDPGVTILEQLCFALTELIYRSDFTVEDQLTGEDGKIGFPEQALHFPEEIFPCRPTTAEDYRQLTLDKCLTLDDARFSASMDTTSQTVCPGIWTASIRLNVEKDDGCIKAEVKKTFARERNLCEDIHDDIVVLEHLDCVLQGKIEIDGLRPPSDVLGEIYYRTVSYIATNDRVRQPQDTRQNEEALIDLLTGPLLAHGRRQPRDAGSQSDNVILANLAGMLQDIQGVVRVHSLSIEVMHAEKAEDEIKVAQGPYGPKVYRDYLSRRHGNAALWLQIPKPGDVSAGESEGVQLLKNGRPITAPVADTWHKFYQLIKADRSARETEVEPAELYARPAGVKRDFRNYFSIQDQFPNAYGINASGVPASAPKDIQARARQLKAYLMLFEQIMANHLANVDGIRELFANAGHAGPTYNYQVLDHATIRDAENLYLEKPENFLAGVIADFDDPTERKSRQLDHMLAVFGESHSQKSLRHFNYYSLTPDPYEEIARNKKEYLSNIVEVTRGRIGGADYLIPDSIGGFAQRVGLLLGFQRHGASLTATMHDMGVDPDGPGATGTAEADPAYGVPEMRDVPKSVPAWRDAWRDAWKILRAPELSRRLLAKGTDLDNYRLVPGSQGNPWTLTLGSIEGCVRQSLDTVSDRAQGARVAHVLRHCLIALCRKSEGLHVVEHVLLRPAGSEDRHACKQPNWDRLNIKPGDQMHPWQDFYPLRFSVFFPDWTARCSIDEFQSLAEETVRVNSPAHVYGQCFWLNYGQMRELETLVDDWACTRRRSGASHADIDDRAVKLIEFVLERQASLHEPKQQHEKDGCD